ncbi:MAG: GGDEF domain-containing protein [Pseudomonadota bacterium]|nr:GGDEF domain-containing protein [Pseudomonadota bacterium]
MRSVANSGVGSLLLSVLLLGCGVRAFCVTPAAAVPLPRHALEAKALFDPETVLMQLPALIKTAQSKENERELALLYLAEANACRVIANWQCQRRAGAQAVVAAEGSGDPILMVRGLINDSRARMAMQDFTGGEQVLGRAELLLKTTPHSELSADISLAYSSMSHAIGKHQLAAEYAKRGLQQLGPDGAIQMRARLLRNQSRANAQLGKREMARALLAQAVAASRLLNDPKLSAEMYLESARLARQDRDYANVLHNAEQIFALAKQLKNSQLQGLGHEVSGLAAMDRTDLPVAASELRAAIQTFRELGLDRDELRVGRDLIGVLLEIDAPKAELASAMRRVIELDRGVLSNDRALAADDFDSRLKYAEQQLDVLRLGSEATLAAERADALARRNRLGLALGMLSLATLLVLSVFFWQQRRSNRRLRAAVTALRESQSRALDVLRLSRGYVFLHDFEGRLLMANPAVAEALGQREDQLVGQPLADFIADADQIAFSEYLLRVQSSEHDEGLMYVRHRRGAARCWRYSARLNAQVPEHAYVIGHAVDVTDQVQQTEALREQSLQDELTGCFNRRYLSVFERRHSEAQRWAVINIDLDHFKRINDTHGHERGDQVLVEVGHFLQQHARAGDAVVRAGGDEFLLLLTDAGDDLAEHTAMRLRDDRALAPCAFSLGYAVRLPNELLPDTIARADAQMYQSRSWARGAIGEIRHG